MDRSWIYARRTSNEYDNGVKNFLEFAIRNAGGDKSGRFYCPCVNCLNLRRLCVEEIREHLICDGFLKSYTRWIWHGELVEEELSASKEVEVDVDMDDRLEDMIRDIGEEAFEQSHAYDHLSSDAERPLYPGCTKFKLLSAVVRLVHLKAKNGWSDKSFTELLQLLTDMLPEGNELPNRYYEAKKMLCPLGLQYKKIHACPNDCILYREEFEGEHKCPKCGASRYKLKGNCDTEFDETTKGPPAKVLWYLPVKPRFK